MLVANYIILIIVIVALLILYQKYLEKNSILSGFDDYNEIKKYLKKDTESSLAKNKKPIMWIYVPHEYNARHWLSFGSRTTDDLNQPYLYLTVKSIIKNCDKSFNICLVDDESFKKLIPNWSINLSVLGEPMKQYVRQLALAKLIYTYGGINVPISFLCFKDLIGLYKKGTQDDNMFVCENYDSNITATNDLFFPDSNFMGALKHNDTLKQFIDFIQRIISSDTTSEPQFSGVFDVWCNNKIHKNKMRLIPGTDVGTKTIDDESVIVETLLGDDYINFYDEMYGIWIPASMILKRRNYEWFARMSKEQILNSKFILAKYMVLALAPGSVNGVIEPMVSKPDWIGFWKVPLTHGTMNLWGPQPINLGRVPRARTSGNLN